MFFLCSNYGLSEWARQSGKEWDWAAITTELVFPKQIQQSALQFPRSSSVDFISGAEMREKWVSNDETVPPKALSLVSLYSNIQSPDFQICGLFSHYCYFFYVSFITCHTHIQRNQVSNHLVFRLFFCLFYCPHTPFLTDIFCLDLVCWFLFVCLFVWFSILNCFLQIG